MKIIQSEFILLSLYTKMMQQKQTNKIFKYNLIFRLISIRYKFLLKGVFEKIFIINLDL